jgi:hypothetical protein
LAWPAVRQVHERTAQRLAEQWKLPPEVTLILSHHHDFVIDGYPHPLGAVVCLADGLATEHGAGIQGEIIQGNVKGAIDVLELNEPVLTRLEQQAREVVQHLD